MKQLNILLVATCTLVLACSDSHPNSDAQASSELRPGYLVSHREAETLVGGNGEVTIIASPTTNSQHFAMGTQKLMPGTAIPVHRHEHADEAFFIHEGAGRGIIGDEHSQLQEGDAIFIPRGVWHGFRADDSELNFVWVIAPPGLDNFFRETRVPPGTPLKGLTPAQMEQIGLKHGIRNKPKPTE